MRMHILSGGSLNMRRSVYYPDAPREERIDIPVVCALLKHRQGNVLFDTGCHPAVAENGAERWGGLAKVMIPVFQPEDAVVHQLPKAGLNADDIDVVICSHLHPDHCGCNAFFRRATVLCQAAELRAAQAPNALEMGFIREDWDGGQTIETIGGQHDLFGDGRITLLPAPGHTAGMMIAHVTLDRDGAFVLASDAVPVAEVLAEKRAPRNSWNVEKTVESLHEIGRLAQGGATVIYGHDAAQWQAARKGEAYYE